ncbi:DUF4134 family protein [Mucilaginibacter gracilis]|uniref:DUF4134 family protein n=1 Tax=Mucilaginibacter gracilis TaxID=423350 RepID=UPI000EB567F9|nr:DUF4134 family protein [Mucilaginibacter gracilis]
MFSKTKKLWASAVLLALSIPVFAQSGVNGLNTATTTLKTYVAPVTNITLVIGGIVGIVGAIRVYSKWNGWNASLVNPNRSARAYPSTEIKLLPP